MEGDMGKVINTCAITVDGLIEAPAPPPDGWLNMEGDHESDQFEQFRNAAGLLAGRKNYEGFAAVWPTMAGDGRWADTLNPMPKWVASTTLTGPLEWNATLIEGDVAEGVRRLKSELDGDLITSGCGAFARFLVEQGLTDEVQFSVHPTIRGAGDRPFHGATVDLELLGSKSYDSGITLLRYRPVGAA
jgi:dihydrofolate reductase